MSVISRQVIKRADVTSLDFDESCKGKILYTKLIGLQEIKTLPPHPNSPNHLNIADIVLKHALQYPLSN